ncbi:hypothetical protein [Nakamurella deserti]|uniref:hypothetical protein n=1 Tax=Nakamurella deserti TaxID=2164074 RepID=UPI000DBE2FDF|nr:hypothetical protein [Nakamurella deserti]
MDALRHADEILAALWRQHPEFAVPGHVGSPMDDRATVSIPRAVIEACEPGGVAGPPLDAELGRVARGVLPPPREMRDTA